MRIPVREGLLACALIIAAISFPGSAIAQSNAHTKLSGNEQRLLVATIVPPEQPIVVTQSLKPVKPKRPTNPVHRVKPNDTLTSIATANKTTWLRLFQKNRQIKHPDHLTVGDTILIPFRDEKLKPREIPAAISTPVSTDDTANVVPSPMEVTLGSSAGNTYTPGYCTWYAKSRRMDLPNNLGNAFTWVSRAAAQGIPTGSTPRVGAIGQSGNHVVYVERVNGDGTVTVSEMNWEGLYVISTRTAAASSFQYIY